MQIADLCAYTLRVCYEQELFRARDIADPYLSAMRRFGRVVKEQTIDYEHERIDGTFMRSYGIRTMAASRFIYELGEVINQVSPTLTEDDIERTELSVAASGVS